jgi:hypothetical protein
MADFNKLFQVHLDLNNNQLVRTLFENLASAPTPFEGKVYYNTTDKNAYVYNGTSWLNMSNIVTSFSGLSDTNITSLTVGEIAQWDGLAWINRTLAEAGISASNHNHALDSLSNVSITANSSGELLMWNGTSWINQTKAELNIAPLDAFNSHTGNTAVHFIINDAGTATNETWSASKINSEIVTLTNLTAGALIYKGGYNASTNVPALDSTPIAGIRIGWTYTVTFSGDFFTEAVQVGDMLIAEISNPTVLADWTIVNKNIPDIVSASETAQGIIEIATNAETIASTDDTRAVTPLKLDQKVASYRFSANIGNGTLTSIPVTHSLNSIDVIVKVARVSDGKVIICDDVITSASVVTFNFNVAPTTSQYRVTIQK